MGHEKMELTLEIALRTHQTCIYFSLGAPQPRRGGSKHPLILTRLARYLVVARKVLFRFTGLKWIELEKIIYKLKFLSIYDNLD
jgi:hypothetical protein